ncbi:MAG: IS630 family transposase [Clostridiales bacterium]|nr:IS630 family transposase [Clostridiales bacterium]
MQRPAKQAINQKPEQVKEWLEETYLQIHAKAKKEGAEIFWGDETAVQNTSNYARGYAPKGQTPVLKVQTVKMHINMISAISNRGKVHFMFSADSMNADKLIDFMERLIKDAGRKVYLILDNLRVHHSKKATQWATDHSNQIALFYLPPYSPEYNPDEYLNHDLKQSIGTREQVKNANELQTQADHFMSGIAHDGDHVKAYFEHPALESYRKPDEE